MRSKTFVLLALSLLLLPATSFAQGSTVDLVDTAVAAGQFQTLATALTKAGLVSALRGEGPFTVFAPTDLAFAKLPEGTLASLLLPENRAKLREILTYHVVPGRVLSTDLMSTAQAKTLSGASVAFGLRVGKANVIRADIECKNGVIHVIDEVLLPPDKPTIAPARIIERAIEIGAPLYNRGDKEGCARTYSMAAKMLLDLPIERVGDLRAVELRAALQRNPHDVDKRAWALRRAFDEILRDESFEPMLEASLPAGFPGPGPAGKVIVKEYPQYRAARAEGGNPFWTLFQHIKRNDVAMTAPVEMTMDDQMRARDMAFLYAKPSQGKAGTQGDVAVLDLESTIVLSIGMRGERSAANIARARAAIEAMIEREGYTKTGEWRLMGYNSPMVPASRKFWELQLPVGSPD
jgi:Fasciclin domain/SOUL heme-binding protein